MADERRELDGEAATRAARPYIEHARRLFSEHAGPAPETVNCLHRCAAVQAGGDPTAVVAVLIEIGDRFPMPRPYWLAVRQAAVCLRAEAAVADVDRRLRG